MAPLARDRVRSAHISLVDAPISVCCKNPTWLRKNTRQRLVASTGIGLRHAIEDNAKSFLDFLQCGSRGSRLCASNLPFFLKL